MVLATHLQRPLHPQHPLHQDHWVHYHVNKDHSVHLEWIPPPGRALCKLGGVGKRNPFGSGNIDQGRQLAESLMENRAYPGTSLIGTIKL